MRKSLVLALGVVLFAAAGPAGARAKERGTLPDSVRRVLSFPNPDLLVTPDFWAFVPDVESLRSLVASQGKEVRLDRQALCGEIEELQARVSAYDLDIMDSAQRQHAGDVLLRLSVLIHVEAQEELALREKERESRMAKYDQGTLAEPPPRPRVECGRQIELCRRIVDELPDYAHIEKVTGLLGYLLHAAGRYYESNNLFVLSLDKGRSWPAEVRLLAGYNYFELGRQAGRESDAGRFYFAQSAQLLDLLSDKTKLVAEEQRLFRLAWACFGHGGYVRAGEALISLWVLLARVQRPFLQEKLLKEQIVRGLVAAYFCAWPDWLTHGLHVPAQQAPELLEALAAGRPYEKDVYQLSLALLREHTKGTEAQTASRLEAYWHMASAYLDRYPDEADCPVVHDRMVRVLQELGVSSAVEETKRVQFARFSLEERERLIQLYGKAGTWRRKQAREPGEAAAKVVQHNLLEMAHLLHLDALEVKDQFGHTVAKTWYRRAATALKRYAQEFPRSAEILEVFERLGGVYLFGLADGSQAAVWYARCRDYKNAENQRALDCAQAALEARAQAVNQAEEHRDPAVPVPRNLFYLREESILPEVPLNSPGRAAKKRRIKPVPIPEVVRLWLAEARAFLATDFKIQMRKELKAFTEYQVARVYFRYGHFGKARKILESLQESYTADDSYRKTIRLYCLKDLIRMCRYENDMDCLERLAKRMQEAGVDYNDGLHEILSAVKAVRLGPERRTTGAAPTADGATQKQSQPASPNSGGQLELPDTEAVEASSLPPHATRLTVGPEDELPLRNLQVKAIVDGFRARVVLDFSFSNQREQRLEGTFQLRLPDGAAPHFLAFGLHSFGIETDWARNLKKDWNDVVKAALKGAGDSFEPRVPTGPKVARMVSRYKAARAYLDTVHRRVDPALLEWAGAGVFSARVYPLEPDSDYRIVVAYDVDLVRRGDDLEFRIELPAAASRSRVEIAVRELQGVPLQFSPEPKSRQIGGAFLVIKYPDPAPRSVSVRLESPGNLLLVGSDGTTGDYFALRVHPQLPDIDDDEPWQPHKADMDGGEDLLFAGRSTALEPDRPLTVVGRGKPSDDAEMLLEVKYRDGVREVRIPVNHRIQSLLTPRTYGEVAVQALEVWVPPLEAAALPYARHFRVTGKSCSLLMLESQRDYRRFGIKPHDDARFVSDNPVGGLLAEVLGTGADAALESDELFLKWVEHLNSKADIELQLPDGVLAAVAQMPGEVFVPPRPGPCPETEEALARLERTPGDLALVRATAYQALMLNQGACVVELLRQAAGWRPSEPDLYYLMALALEQAGGAELALLYFEIILAGNWPRPFQHFAGTVRLDYLLLLRRMAAGELPNSVPELAQARLEAVKGELRFEQASLLVSAIWSTDGSDVDLLVFEPSGELCQGDMPHTGSGGRCLRDGATGYGPEMYVAEEVIPGRYRIALRHIAGNENRIATRTTVLVSVYRDWGRSNEAVERFVVPLGPPGNQVVPVQ